MYKKLTVITYSFLKAINKNFYSENAGGGIHAALLIGFLFSLNFLSLFHYIRFYGNFDMSVIYALVVCIAINLYQLYNLIYKKRIHSILNDIIKVHTIDYSIFGIYIIMTFYIFFKSISFV